MDHPTDPGHRQPARPSATCERVGLLTLPSGRRVYWTGTLAIGIRYQPRRDEAVQQSALWVQRLMLGGAA